MFDVRRKTFPDHEGSFPLAILLDMGGGLIRPAWLVPMSELAAAARVNADKVSITPSATEGSADRHTPYRCGDMAEVACRSADHLDAMSPAAGGSGGGFPVQQATLPLGPRQSGHRPDRA
jgi:hypothetical protein